MKIGVIGSMQFTEEMLELCEQLRQKGHKAQTSIFAKNHVGKTDKQKEKIKLEQKYNEDAIRQDAAWLKNVDAVLVANYDKNGIKSYIGGNAFLEMGYVHILGKVIYLLNPVPSLPNYETEIIAMRPVVLNGDLSKIK